MAIVAWREQNTLAKIVKIRDAASPNQKEEIIQITIPTNPRKVTVTRSSEVLEETGFDFCGSEKNSTDKTGIENMIRGEF